MARRFKKGDFVSLNEKGGTKVYGIILGKHGKRTATYMVTWLDDYSVAMTYESAFELTLLG